MNQSGILSFPCCCCFCYCLCAKHLLSPVDCRVRLPLHFDSSSRPAYLDMASCCTPKPENLHSSSILQILPISLVKFTTSGSVSNPHTTGNQVQPVPSIPQVSINCLRPLPTNSSSFFKHKNKSVNAYGAPGCHQPTRSTDSQDGLREKLRVICKMEIKTFSPEFG